MTDKGTGGGRTDRDMLWVKWRFKLHSGLKDINSLPNEDYYLFRMEKIISPIIQTSVYEVKRRGMSLYHLNVK